jgi:hypothetical protein
MSPGFQPHLSHLYCGTPAGFGFPHSAQNLPVFPLLPHEQSHPAGCGFPHSAQNLPVFPL